MTVEPGDGTPMSSQPPAGPPASSAGGTSTEALQSMLSRAVEGQLGEQRELMNAVTDMRNQLMRLSQELAELRVRPSGDDGSDAHNNAVTVEMREAVRFVSERLDGVTRLVSQRGEELADIRTALTAIDAHVRSQAETIVVLSNGLQSLPSFGERVSNVQDNLQVLHRQLVGIEAAVGPSEADDKIGERLTAIESAIAPLALRLNEIGDRGTAQSELLSQLQGASAQLQRSVSGVHDSVAGIHEKVAEPVGDLDARIGDSVAAAIRETEQRLMAHVDEAVVALAETLLRRRAPSTAGQITGTPMADAPTTEPAAPVNVPPAAPATTPSLVAAAAAAAAESLPADDADEVEDTEPVDDLAEPADADTDEAHDPDEDTEESEDADEANEADKTEPDDVADAPSVGVLDADADADAVAGPVDSLPPAFPSTAADDGPWYANLPPPLAGTAVEEPPKEAWAPQTPPPARNPADPTVTFDESKKKRRWGRNK